MKDPLNVRQLYLSSHQLSGQVLLQESEMPDRHVIHKYLINDLIIHFALAWHFFLIS